MSTTDAYILERYTGEQVEETLNMVGVNSAAIEREKSDRVSADSNLREAISAEGATRKAADDILQEAIDEEFSQREAAVSNLQGAIDKEAAARKAADSALSTAIANERNDRVAADSGLRDDLNAEVSERKTEDRDIRSEIAELTKTVPNDIRTDYSDDGVSIDLKRDGVQIATDTIEPATEELAGVMSAADKIQQRLLGERIEEVNDALTTERGARESAIEDVNNKIKAEQEARNSADGMLATAIDSEKQTRKAAITTVKGMITDETAAREAADSEIRNEIASLTDTVADGMFASYDDSSVTMDLKRGDVSLYGETIASATPTNAGVMSSEDKRKLEAAIYQVDDTDYFPDYVETQIRGYDGDGHSVVINAATEKLAGVMSAEDKIEQRNIRTFVETFKKNLIPSGLTVSCLERITLGNVEPIYITADLSPETAYRNIIYISDNKAVTVGTDGRLTPVAVGKSVVSVIPTCNTSLAKTIIVEVGKPLARLVNDRATLRLTSSGAFRLT